MEFNASFLDHDLAFDDSRRLAGRQATAAALARCRQRFGAFLQGDDLPIRFDLVDMEIRQIVAAVADEFHADDSDQILASVTSVLAAGGFCDTCRKWKSGPNAGCTCEKVDTSRDNTDEGNEEKILDAENAAGESDGKEASVHQSNKYIKRRGDKYVIVQKGTGKVLSEHDSEEKANASFRAMEMHKHEGRWYVVSEALEHEELPDPKFGTEPWVNGPPVKIDKKKWKPNALNPDGNLPPIDTDMKGTRHPTEHQDIAQIADHTKPISDQTDAGSKMEKLKGTDGFDDAGFNTKRNITQYPTKSFGDTHHQQKPVTDEVWPAKNKQAANGACPNCGANPDSETRCSVCKGWASARQGAVGNEIPMPQMGVPQEGIPEGVGTCQGCGRVRDGIVNGKCPECNVRSGQPQGAGLAQRLGPPQNYPAPPGMSMRGAMEDGNPNGPFGAPMQGPADPYQGGEQPTGNCPNCNGPADPPTCPHCGYSEALGAEHGGNPAQTYGGGHAMDDPEHPDNRPEYDHYAHVTASPYQDSMEPESGATEQSAFDSGFNNHPCSNCGYDYDSHGDDDSCPTDLHGPKSYQDSGGGYWDQRQQRREQQRQKWYGSSDPDKNPIRELLTADEISAALRPTDSPE